MPYHGIKGTWFRPSLQMHETSMLQLRVQLNDIDLFMHVNNGRFPTLMDLGRTDYLARTGMWQLFRRRGWRPVAAGLTMRFRRELRLGQRFTLVSSIAGWDDRWVFFDQRFMRGEVMHARGYAKIGILESGQLVAPATLAEAANAADWRPELPDDVTAWLASGAS